MRPFRLQTTDAEFDDLYRRLQGARLPAGPIGDAGDESALTLDRLAALVEYWRDGFDWRAVERSLAAVPQSEAHVDGQRIHFAHLDAPADVTDRVAVVAFHGWPYSFVEMLPLARALAEHPVDLGDGRTLGFDVVVPSLPGFGPSAPLVGRPFTGPVIAELMHGLMTDVLGHRRYLTYGEDVGSTTSDWLAALHPGSVAGLFASMPRSRRPPEGRTPPTPSVPGSTGTSGSGPGGWPTRRCRRPGPRCWLRRSPTHRSASPRGSSRSSSHGAARGRGGRTTIS